ncbi:MarR family winged helix-turn-helix transcriptional regulator [Isoptericola sp. NPDC055881]
MTRTPPTLTGLSTYLLAQTGKRARARLADRLGARGLRLWHLAVLAALDDFGPQSQRDVGARFGIHASDVTKVVDELAERDLVSRERDPADRRRVVLALTAPGRTLLGGLRQDAAAVQDEVLAALTPEEREVLHGLLLRVHGDLDTADDRGALAPGASPRED